MNLRTVAAALAAAVVVPLAVSAPAPAFVSWTVTDDTGDVKLYGTDGEVTKAQQRSIDIRRVRAISTPSGGTAFKVRIKQVLPNADFDQMVFLVARPPKGEGKYPMVFAGWSLQQPGLGYATLQVSDENYVNCDPLPTTTYNAGADTIGQVIPPDCVVPSRMRLRFSTATGVFRSEGPGYSFDKLLVTKPMG